MWKPNGLVLRSVVRSEIWASDWASTAGSRLRRRYRRPFDRGQTAVEYLGIIAVAVAIVLVLMTSGLGNTILSKIKAQINKIGG
ncbi:hypothetical protein AB0M28_15135 [Streptomyces sp. NPDC051940]|uniref:Flp family type IVb pilin n=1 Tax=Streptomyces sp. NPDC051940 TaxID=3155675 RepID=UPI00342EB502